VIWKKFGITSQPINVPAADRILDEIHNAILSLVNLPQQGHIRPDLTSPPLRFHLVRDYAIVYAAEDKPLPIIAVLQARRNPRVLAAILSKRS
jgi:plasmid stabilization system protein ParE